MKKYGIIKGETDINPVKTASDQIIDNVSLDPAQITDSTSTEDVSKSSDNGATSDERE
tara:strand:+ start:3361 stop:3534 length:174 start_codon:yes stop_codon:yes gene_type:complete